MLFIVTSTPSSSLATGAAPISVLASALREAISLVAFGILVATATRYDFNLFGMETGGLLFNDLAKSLLSGHAGVNARLAIGEGFYNGKETVVYFGPWPAIMRLPLIIAGLENLCVSRISCILTFLVTTLSIRSILTQAQRIGARRAERSADTQNAFYLTLTLAVGSPLLIILAWPSLFNEAILWALAGSMCAYQALFRIVFYNERTARIYLQFATFAGITLLSRITFAIPLFLVGAALIITHLYRCSFKVGTRSRLAALIIPACCATAVQGWYNYARYDSLLAFSPPGGIASYLKVSSFGGEWNLARIPANFMTYFGVRHSQLSSSFPYLRPVPALYSPPEIFIQPGWWREDVGTLPFVSPLIFVLFLLGLLAIGRIRSKLALAGLVLFSLQPILILSYYAATPRYFAEFMPLIVFALAMLLTERRVLLPKTFLTILCAVSILSATTMSLAWNMKWRFNRSQEGIARFSWLPKPLVICPFTPPIIKRLRHKRVLESYDYMECELAPMGS